jgi:hypothetical protein
MCAFCRTQPARKNREHVLPDWLADVFSSRDPQMHYRRVQSQDGHHDKVYDQKLFRAKTTCTCGPCNHGWMSDIEGEARTLLPSMMLSSVSFVLTREDQELLGTTV